ncbi:hypothetical protein C6A36_01085, partial [Desulfobacteraceae bacterium SEEP-SAG10]
SRRSSQIATAKRFRTSCQKHRSKHLDLNCIYRIFYKIAKKSAKRRTDFDITNPEPIYRKKDTLQISGFMVAYEIFYHKLMVAYSSP